MPGADEATRSARALVDQLDDYVLPRLMQLDAPLLAVVGGSTGAGKSTLVNSLVRTVVSPAGVLRPTTRSPVLVCHPDDAAWFSESHVLPGLSRTTGATGNHQTLHLAPSQALTAGLAFLDAPDIDSVVEANRDLAHQLLAAADLWLFVTTAARYADAVPWDLLNTAQERGTALAMVLNRVPPGVEHEVSGHLREMLRDHGVKDPTLFVLPETTLEAGLLPEPIIGPLQVWFTGLAASAEQRAAVVRQTLDGALTSVWPRASELADASDDQATAVEELRASARAAYAAAVSRVSTGISDGALLRGEVLARWQEFVGTGDLLRALENRVGRLRDRLTAAISGRPPRASQLKVALESGMSQLITSSAEQAADDAAASWRTRAAGIALLDAAEGDLGRSSPALAGEVERLVRDWQGSVLEMVRTEGASKRIAARVGAYGVNATGLVVMIAVFASTHGLTGLEIAVAGGTSVLSQKLLEAIFGDQAVRQLADRARADLVSRVEAVLAGEVARYSAALDVVAADPEVPTRLRASAMVAEAARKRMVDAGSAKRTSTGEPPPGVEKPSSTTPSSQEEPASSPASSPAEESPKIQPLAGPTVAPKKAEPTTASGGQPPAAPKKAEPTTASGGRPAAKKTGAAQKQAVSKSEPPAKPTKPPAAGAKPAAATKPVAADKRPADPKATADPAATADPKAAGGAEPAGEPEPTAEAKAAAEPKPGAGPKRPGDADAKPAGDAAAPGDAGPKADAAPAANQKPPPVRRPATRSTVAKPAGNPATANAPKTEASTTPRTVTPKAATSPAETAKADPVKRAPAAKADSPNGGDKAPAPDAAEEANR